MSRHIFRVDLKRLLVSAAGLLEHLSLFDLAPFACRRLLEEEVTEGDTGLRRGLPLREVLRLSGLLRLDRLRLARLDESRRCASRRPGEQPEPQQHRGATIHCPLPPWSRPWSVVLCPLSVAFRGTDNGQSTTDKSQLNSQMKLAEASAIRSRVS